ncbi:MAG TPA: FG-GAP-like repeat-containing protein [Candidatus Aquilonibacter sp.]|nr:FG-GAP-like repeat-containing protein [Candidatus Aquilonibacter sp.]
MSGGKRSRDCRKRTTGVTAPKATERGCFLRAGLVLALVCACGWARPTVAQTTPSFTAPAAYNAQPGTVPVGVATEFNNASGYLDFAVLEQVPNGSSGDQVEIFHGKSDGTFCTNCNNVNPNPDVIVLGPGVTGNAIAVGQFRASGLYDIAVATNAGIVILENKNDGSGTFTPNSTLSVPNGFASLSVGQFDGTGNYDIAAVSPAVNGAISFTVFFGDGNGNFPASSTSSVNSGYFQCSAILPGSFQGLPNAADLAIVCNTLYEEDVLVYLNYLGKGTDFAFWQTVDAGQRVVGASTGVAIGTLNSLPAIFISPPAGSFTSYQFANFAFTSVFMGGNGFVPPPSGSLALLYQSGAAVDFATSSSVSGVGVSTFTGYTQSGTSINGNWNSTESLGPAGVLATGFSPNLNQGTGAYLVVDAGVHGAPNPNLEPEVDERSISVYLATLNGNGTLATASGVPVYPGSAMFTTGDFNGDGKMDLAVAEGGVDVNGNTTLSIYLADPDGTFPSASYPPVSVTVNIGEYNSVDAIVAGKFRPAQNGKTYSDLAVFSSGQISILTSNGDGTFTAGNTYSVPGDPNYEGVLTAVDVNGDGLDDIVLTLPEHSCQGSGSVSQGAVYVLVSNGDGTFRSPVLVAPPVVNPVSVTAAKFVGAGQGQNDLVFANGGEICSGTNAATTTGTAVGILQNNVPASATMVSSTNFTPGSILTQSSDLPVPNVTAVASADLDGNGSPDLVVSSTAGIQVLLNHGSGIFVPTMQGTVPLYHGDNPNDSTLCSGSYTGCVAYDSQLATGSFFAAGENDVAASAGGVVYIFQNLGNTGILQPPTQGFVAGPDSMGLSAAIFNTSGLNNLLVGTLQGTAYLLNNGQGTATGPPQPPVIMKAFGTMSMPVVDVSSLTFTIINPNALATLTGINFTDSFPTGLAVATPNNLTNTCGGTATATAGSDQVMLSGLTLAASTSCTITVNVTGTSDAGATETTPVTLTNSVKVGSDQGAGNTSAASITLFQPGPPQIYKYFGATSIALGGVTTLNFTISNLNYNTGLTGITFTDNLPAGLAVASPSNLTNTCGGATTAAAGSASVSLVGGARAAGTFCEISVNVIGTQAQAGPWINNVTASAYESGSLVSSSSASLTVVGPLPPTITSVTPNIGAQGQQNLQVNITGMNFVAFLTTVTIGAGTPGITVSTTVNSATSITAMVNIDPSTPAGNYDVVVTVYGVPPPATLVGGFTVAVPIPTDTEQITVSDSVTITPLINFSGPAALFSTAGLGFSGVGGVRPLTVSNVGGASLTFSGAPMISSSSGSFTITQTVCSNGATSLPTTLPSGGACTFTVSYAPSATPANDTGTIVFTDNAALSSPASSGTAPTYMQTISLNGEGSGTGPLLPPSATVTIPPIDETITVTDMPAFPDVADAETITVNDVVTVHVQGSALSPTITSVTPNSGPAAGGETVTIVGQNFQTGAAVLFASTPATSVTVNSATSISVVAPPLTAGTTVTVTNPDGQSATGSFTVRPEISSISPASGRQGQTLDVAITGVGFVNGVTTANFGTQIFVHSLTVADGTHATANITIESAAPVGKYVVSVATGTFTASLNGFTVQPAVWSLSPVTGRQGQTLDVAISGEFFQNGVTTANFGPNITAGPVTVTDGDDATVTITIAPNAPVGLQHVVVTTRSHIQNLPFHILP